MSSVRTRLLATFGLALAATALSPAAAGAKPAEPTGGDNHCVVYVVGKADDGELKMSNPECFSTESAAATRAAEPQMNLDLDSLDDRHPLQRIQRNRLVDHGCRFVVHGRLLEHPRMVRQQDLLVVQRVLPAASLRPPVQAGQGGQYLRRGHH